MDTTNNDMPIIKLSKTEYLKIYRDTHKEYFNEYRRKYYEEKKDKVL